MEDIYANTVIQLPIYNGIKNKRQVQDSNELQKLDESGNESSTEVGRHTDYTMYESDVNSEVNKQINKNQGIYEPASITRKDSIESSVNKPTPSPAFQSKVNFPLR